MMRIEIKNEEDRIAVAAVLVKNGYTVRITRERPSPKGVFTYYLEFEK